MKRQFSEYKLSKAPHSVYTAIGAQQGKPGMFLFLLIMWSCFRTLVFMKSTSPEQERARRILFALVFSYALSGWMVDFAYRPSFFLFAAAVSVLHRLTYVYESTSASEVFENNKATPEPTNHTRKPVTGVARADAARARSSVWMRSDTEVLNSDDESELIRSERIKSRKKFDWIDVAATLIFMKVVAIAWVYFINNM